MNKKVFCHAEFNNPRNFWSYADVQVKPIFWDQFMKLFETDY